MKVAAHSKPVLECGNYAPATLWRHERHVTTRMTRNVERKKDRQVC